VVVWSHKLLWPKMSVWPKVFVTLAQSVYYGPKCLLLWPKVSVSVAQTESDFIL